MTTYNTGNPLGSTDARDLYDNAQLLDKFVNGTGTYADRLGNSRRSLAKMDADFNAQLADAESDLNVYRADAAASAAQALGYLNTYRTTSYGAYAADPVFDPLGNPPTVGDEYFNTTVNLLKRFNGTTWQASDLNSANLAAPTGSSLVGYLPAGTGAVPTDTQTTLRRTVYVDQYGANGNGSDDTAAFYRAMAVTNGEILLDPNKTYAVNIVITKRGTRINGRSGDNISIAGTSIRNLIPYDPTKPVIQIGNDTNNVGGVVIENLSIHSTSPSGVNGTTGLSLAGGANGNYIKNVQIGDRFSQYNLVLSGGATHPCMYNQFTNIQLWTFGGVSQIATLAAYYGNTWCTANYITNFNISGPGGGATGYALLLDSAQLYALNGWIQANNNCGLRFNKNFAANTPVLIASNVAVDSDSSTDVLIESGVASDTLPLPVGFLSGNISIDGKYKNAAGTITDTRYGAFLKNQSLITFPVFYGYQEQYNPDSGQNVKLASVSGTLNDIGFGGGSNNRNTFLLAASGAVYFATAGTSRTIVNATAFVPGSDGTYNLGSGGARFNNIYAVNNVIQTSDERKKQDISNLDAAEKRVAAALKGMVKKFRFRDAVREKGDAARVHIGVIAQEVISAFQAEDLDPMRYGIVCYDEWGAEDAITNSDTGETISPARLAGNCYGIRYEELLAFIIAAL